MQAGKTSVHGRGGMVGGREASGRGGDAAEKRDPGSSLLFISSFARRRNGEEPPRGEGRGWMAQ